MDKDIATASALVDFASMKRSSNSPERVRNNTPLVPLPALSNDHKNKKIEVVDVPPMPGDRRREKSPDAPTIVANGIGSKNQKFPVKLMRVVDCDKYNHIISWTSDGQSFVIHKPMSLVEKDNCSALPHVISDRKGSKEEPKFKSFLRKLYRWGFLKRYNKADDLTYFHKRFRRGNLPLCMSITRLPAILNKSRKDQAGATNSAALVKNQHHNNMIQNGQQAHSMLNNDITNLLSLQNLGNILSRKMNMASNITGVSPRALSTTNNQCISSTTTSALQSLLLEGRFTGESSNSIQYSQGGPSTTTTRRSWIGSPNNHRLSHTNFSRPSDPTTNALLPLTSLMEGGLGAEARRAGAPASSLSVAERLLKNHDAQINSLLKERNDLIDAIRNAQSNPRDHLASLPFGTSQHSPMTSSFQQELQNDSGHFYSSLQPSSSSSADYNNYDMHSRGRDSSFSFLRDATTASTSHASQRNTVEEEDYSDHSMIMKIALKGLVDRQQEIENELSRYF
mmetsp:Transcript_26844/g.40313  ORF Transcript_26844/g.40313 Transcript_26844/m.40313 type:complete len:509 (+) Transcript_26844:104-1630(+)